MNCRSLKIKSSYISDFINENMLDCGALTETWLSANEDENRAVLSTLVPAHWATLHVPRISRGGGVGFMYKILFSVKLDSTPQFTSVECQTVLMDISSYTFRFVIIYRKTPSNKNKIKKRKAVSSKKLVTFWNPQLI